MHLQYGMRQPGIMCIVAQAVSSAVSAEDVLRKLTPYISDCRGVKPSCRPWYYRLLLQLLLLLCLRELIDCYVCMCCISRP